MSHEIINQQNVCAPSEDLDQPGHPLSLIRIFAARSVGNYGPKLSPCADPESFVRWGPTLTKFFLVRWGGE